MIRMESESGWRTIEITYERSESMNGCMRWVIQKRHNRWPTLRLVIDAIRPFSISDPHWTLPPNDRFDRITIPKSWHRFLKLCTGLEEHRISQKFHWIVSWRIGEIGSSIRASIDFPFQQQRIDIGQDWSDATHRWMIHLAISLSECQRKNASSPSWVNLNCHRSFRQWLGVKLFGHCVEQHRIVEEKIESKLTHLANSVAKILTFSCKVLWLFEIAMV